MRMHVMEYFYHCKHGVIDVPDEISSDYDKSKKYIDEHWSHVIFEPYQVEPAVDFEFEPLEESNYEFDNFTECENV